MGMDSIDFKNRNKFYCPECQEQLHPESEEYSNAVSQDKGVDCENCSFDKLVNQAFEGVPV